MWFLSVLIAFSLSNGLLADLNDDLENCIELSGVNDIDLKKIEEVEIETACPMVIQFMECVERAVQAHTGMKLDELARLLAGTDVGKGAQLLVNLKNLVTDLCTEGSELNTEYKEHEACLNTISPNNELCTENAAAAYEAYNSLEEATGNENARKQCLIEAYKSACLAALVHETCGQGAFEFYQTLVKRIGHFRSLICSPKALEELKTKFVNNLDLPEHKRNIFRAAFDLRRRKK